MTEKNNKELFKSFFILGLVSISILFIFVYCDYFYNYTNKDGALQFSYIALFISILTLFALGTFEFYTKYYETNKSLKINRYKLEMLMQEIATNQDILNNVFLKNKEVTLKNKIKEKKSVYSILASGFLTTSLKDILENIYLENQFLRAKITFYHFRIDSINSMINIQAYRNFDVESQLLNYKNIYMLMEKKVVMTFFEKSDKDIDKNLKYIYAEPIDLNELFDKLINDVKDYIKNYC